MTAGLPLQLKELLYLSRGLRAFGARRTTRGRRRVASLLRMGQWSRYVHRRNLATGLTPDPRILIPENTGFAKLDALDRDVVRAAMASAERHWAGLDLDRALAARGDRPFVAHGLGPVLRPGDPVLALALHPVVVAAVSRYIGMLPVIENVVIWYSPNDRRLDNSSQYYHLDGQDVRTVQMFLFLEPVTEDNGPLVVLPADASEALAQRVGYRKTPGTKRLDDGVVEAAGAAVRFTGDAGDVFIVDTDRCFHFGSREGRSPRRVMVIQYYSPFAFVLPHRWDTALPLAHLAGNPGFSEVERLVLGGR